MADTPTTPEAAPAADTPKLDIAAASSAPVTTPAPTTGSAPAAAAQEAVKSRKRAGFPPKRGKKLRQLIKSQAARVEKEGLQPLKKAITTLKSLKRVKFDETVEVHMKLGVDPKQADQAVRGSVGLPHGIGKAVRILVFAQGADIEKAKAAGAEYAGGAELIQKIQGEGWLEFDVVLAAQNMMGQVSRLGKVLGPRGLMPTPKAGTVVAANGDVGSVVKEFKAGKVEYRADAGGCVHAGVGKMSFEDDKLIDNINAFVEQVRSVKPSGVKGNYILSVVISATMSPGIRITF